MKVANLTILKEQANYGQRLQAYALQKYLSSEFGAECFTLDIYHERISKPGRRWFEKFENECMDIRPFMSYNPIPMCDRVMIGGDQVLSQACDIQPIYNLLPMFGPVRRNVFFYGAGLEHNRTIKYDLLSSLEPMVIAYGLREDCVNADYVKVVDPVYLLRDSWCKIAENTAHGGTVTYMMSHGCPSELSVERNGELKKHATDIRDGTAIDPRGFLGMIKNADRVVTNSYHGLSFSLMFKVPLIRIKNRDDHRVVNLLDMLGVRFDGERVVNYDEVFENMDRWVGKSRNFLERCLAHEPKDYCAVSRDAKTHAVSSSGGFCPEAARKTFSEGGVVYGGAYSEDFKKVVCTKVSCMEEYFSKLSRSKYSFCQLPDMEALKNEMLSGKRTLFIGSPCQIAAVKKYVGDVPDTCVLCDFRCRGYSSPKRLAAFVDMLQADGGKVTGINFRPCHTMQKIEVHVDGKPLIFGQTIWNSFVFNSLPRCKSCPFAHGMLSDADITVGDFWRNRGDRLKLGKKFAAENGCNLVSVNTQKGERFFRSVSSTLELKALTAQ